jgi:hypothetical protein
MLSRPGEVLTWTFDVSKIIVVLWIRIRKFLGLLEPDPSLFVIRILIWIRILPSSSKKK